MAQSATTLEKIDAIHAASKIVEVALNKLQIDGSYQRDPSWTMVDEIAENWDEIASELILVSDRGTRPEGGEVLGGLFIVNGQHRSLGAQKRNLKKIWARVIDLKEEVDPGALEAEFRLKTNRRLGDRPTERFKAQVRAGDPDSLALVKLLAQFDTEINITPKNDQGINCVSTLENMYAVDDGALLAEVLSMMKKAYGHVDTPQASTILFKGLAWFILNHSMEVDQNRLSDKLGEIGYTALERRARGHQSTMGLSLWINTYRTIVELYNEKLAAKNRLEFKTRGSSRTFKGGSWGQSDH